MDHFFGGEPDKPQEALKAIEICLNLDPHSVDARVLKGSIALQRGDMETANALARDALEQNPEHLCALTLMGSIYLRSGDIEAARDHALWALEIDPHDPEALSLLTSIKIRQSKLNGLWWRWNAWVTKRGTNNAILILIAAFVIVRLAVVVFEDYGYSSGATSLALIWLFFCVYTWKGCSIMDRMVHKELEQVRLNPNF